MNQQPLISVSIRTTLRRNRVLILLVAILLAVFIYMTSGCSILGGYTEHPIDSGAIIIQSPPKGD